jgi:hypothetical protein
LQVEFISPDLELIRFSRPKHLLSPENVSH